MQINLSGCAMCGAVTDLQLSHIIPKFVYRTLTKTGVGKLRGGMNPNIPMQDGEKHYMLCEQCEELFCTYETEFANKIFHPFQEGTQKRFSYDEWLKKFIVSVSWRSLYLDLIDFVRNSIGSAHSINNLAACEGTMKDYLLGKRNDIDKIENHIFFFDDIDSASKEFIGLNPHLNIRRGAISYTTIIESNQAHYTYTNMAGIILFTLYGRQKSEEWINTQVFDAGTIEAKNQIVRSHCPDELHQTLMEAKRIRSEIGEKQQAKINERYEKVKGDEASYPVFEFIEKDKKIRKWD